MPRFIGNRQYQRGASIVGAALMLTMDGGSERETVAQKRHCCIGREVEGKPDRRVVIEPERAAQPERAGAVKIAEAGVANRTVDFDVTRHPVTHTNCGANTGIARVDTAEAVADLGCDTDNVARDNQISCRADRRSIAKADREFILIESRSRIRYQKPEGPQHQSPCSVWPERQHRD